MNSDFKITFDKTVEEGSAVCFGYIPETLLE